MEEGSGLNTSLLLDKNELKMALRNRKVSRAFEKQVLWSSQQTSARCKLKSIFLSHSRGQIRPG